MQALRHVVRMKRSLPYLLAILGCLAPDIATGQNAPTVQTLGQAGIWTAIRGTSDIGNSMCGMSASWSNGVVFTIRVFSNPPDNLSFAIAKQTWNIPNNTKLKLIIMIGEKSWNLDGFGFGSHIEVPLSFSQSTALWADLRSGGRLGVIFEGGNEPPVSTNTDGAGAAIDMMAGCLQQWPLNSGTQPFTSAPTQPVFPQRSAAPSHRPRLPAQRPPPTPKATAPSADDRQVL